MDRVAIEFFQQIGFNEPISGFATRFPGKLESCLWQSFARFGRTIFLPRHTCKAAALFFFCTKDHPFENGNKRFAVSVMLYFLAKNGYWLDIDPVQLYQISKAVAEEDDESKVIIDKVVRAFKPHFEVLHKSSNSSK